MALCFLLEIFLVEWLECLRKDPSSLAGRQQRQSRRHPIEWVNKRKLRVKDSVNNVWWFSKTEWPKADAKKVLAPYSERMKKLLEDPEGFYTPKKRPSGHDIGKSFATDNGGAIPSNLLQISNSESNGQYLRGCKAAGIKGHPARFPAKLPEFFIRFLTNPGDLVVDIFGGGQTPRGRSQKLREDAELAASFQRNTSPLEPFDSWTMRPIIREFFNL